MLPKLIAPDSYLKRLPLAISKRDMQIFDSIRFAFEMIDGLYEHLYNELYHMSNDGKKNAPMTFNYAWSIIDCTHRLVRIVAILPFDDKISLIGSLNYIEEFRHSYQHLDERINSLVDNIQSPTFGILTWNYIESVRDFKFTRHAFLSGNHVSSEINYVGIKKKNLRAGITDIILYAYSKKAIEALDYIKLHKDLSNLCKTLESKLERFCSENNFIAPDWAKRQDVHIIFKNE